eukprot:gb/GEZN01012172.1/.p1 GENE.gb/GEZN01012172.1/~~gb/GEZN01012172.1/.p1  ORF type:complete len:219 (+),score=39.28 gb/GEZN01012172.1/:77-733(+)
MSSPTRRRDIDVMKLLVSNFEVSQTDSKERLFVKFEGPKDSPYEGGIWKVLVSLPVAYPFKSPSIGFCNKIYHPNIDLASGSVCLDVINQTWSPMFDLVNIFSIFLPQLLLYPNPSDPLNGEAAALLLQDKASYEKRVRDVVKAHASQEITVAADSDDESDSDDEPSSVQKQNALQSSMDGIEPAMGKGGKGVGMADSDEEFSDMDDDEETGVMQLDL